MVCLLAELAGYGRCSANGSAQGSERRQETIHNSNSIKEEERERSETNQLERVERAIEQLGGLVVLNEAAHQAATAARQGKDSNSAIPFLPRGAVSAGRKWSCFAGCASVLFFSSSAMEMKAIHQSNQFDELIDWICFISLLGVVCGL